jgi:hypothetical protein
MANGRNQLKSWHFVTSGGEQQSSRKTSSLKLGMDMKVSTGGIEHVRGRRVDRTISVQVTVPGALTGLV